MKPPRFLFAPDPENEQLYIVHTIFPLSVILVHQTIPAQLLIMDTECYPDEDDTEDIEDYLTQEEIDLLAAMLLDAAEWYRNNSIEKIN